MSEPEVYVRPVRYEVSVWPDDLRDSTAHAMNSRSWCITVADRGHGKWAVIAGGHDSSMPVVLGRDGEWDYEPRPSSREDNWLESHRFSLDEALALAREHAPGVTINDLSAVQVLERNRKRSDG